MLSYHLMSNVGPEAKSLENNCSKWPWGHSRGSFSIVIARIMTVVSQIPLLPPHMAIWSAPLCKLLHLDAGFSVSAKLQGVVEVMCNICGGCLIQFFSDSYCFDMRPWLDFPLYFSWGETDYITMQAKYGSGRFKWAKEWPWMLNNKWIYSLLNVFIKIYPNRQSPRKSNNITPIAATHILHGNSGNGKLKSSVYSIKWNCTLTHTWYK